MQSTGDGDGDSDLLAALTDEELVRYREIAAHQCRLEWRHGGLQVLAALAAFVTLGGGVLAVSTGSATLTGLAMVGLAFALGYWPYQKARMRRMWRHHEKAVEAELDSRQAVAGSVRR